MCDKSLARTLYGGNVKTQLKITIYCDNIIKKTQ